jgi:ATPase subunit of ABC transporter with duplicated ATPase domains
LSFVNLRKVGKSFGGAMVLDGLDFMVSDGSRIGLVGANGSGKSTLLKIMAGIEAVDAGNVELRRGVKVAYLPQRVDGEGRSALEIVRAARPDLQTLEDELQRCARIVGSPEATDMNLIHRALETQEDLLRRFRELGGPGFEGEARSLLGELAGLDRAAMSRPTREMREGQRKLVALVSCLVRRPDILLLDEPETNLESACRERLEGNINRFEGAVVAASRKRSFLDRVSEYVFEVREGKIFPLEGGHGAKEGAANVVDLAERR